MKKWIVPLFVFCSLLIGCGSPEWSATMEDAKSNTSGADVPLILHLQTGGQPVSGQSIRGVLEMQRMEHGIVEVEFTETSAGVYESKAKLPMGGDWVANLKASKDGETQELLTPFKVSGSQAAVK